MNPQSSFPVPVMYFPSTALSPKGYIISRATNWRPNVQIAEPKGDIAPSRLHGVSFTFLHSSRDPTPCMNTKAQQPSVCSLQGLCCAIWLLCHVSIGTCFLNYIYSNYILVVWQKSYTDLEVVCLNKEYAIAFLKRIFSCACGVEGRYLFTRMHAHVDTRGHQWASFLSRHGIFLIFVTSSLTHWPGTHQLS